MAMLRDLIRSYAYERELVPWFIAKTANPSIRNPIIWYIANVITGRVKKIGPYLGRRKLRLAGRGINWLHRAEKIARERNAKFFLDVKKLPLYFGIDPRLDVLITKKLKEGSYESAREGSNK